MGTKKGGGIKAYDYEVFTNYKSGVANGACRALPADGKEAKAWQQCPAPRQPARAALLIGLGSDLLLLLSTP